MARRVPPLDTAALAIAVGVLANTVLKAGIAVAFDDRQFAMRVGGTLIASAAVGASVIAVLWA
jgi:uncharacterized membrane protein (DUF4010 family)